MAASELRPPDFQVTVNSRPAPQGSMQAYVDHRTGQARVKSDNPRTDQWRRDVVAAVLEQLRGAGTGPRLTRTWSPLEGPIHLAVEFYLPRPASRSKTRRELPMAKPDLDKLVRSTGDALTTSGVIRDDAQITDLTLRKRYAVLDDALGHPWELPGPGAVISLFRIDAESTWADEPIERVVARRMPLPALPEALTAFAEIVTRKTSTVSASSPGVVVVPASATDTAAAQIVERLAKLAQATRDRTGSPSKWLSPSAGHVLVIEHGLDRLASHPGRPWSKLQSAVVDALPTFDGLVELDVVGTVELDRPGVLEPVA